MSASPESPLHGGFAGVERCAPGSRAAAAWEPIPDDGLPRCDEAAP